MKKNIIIDGTNFTFDEVIKFEGDLENQFECFFFKNDKLIFSEFLTKEEVKNIN